MVARRVLALLVLLLVANAAICQTFQYSHGWTNGKRSEFPIVADMASLANERFVNGDTKRLRMLLHGDADEQLYLQPLLFHCDLLAKQSKPIRADDYALRRDKEQNDNGY
ncbi:hypothetical protein HN011_001533 [Eciton burchellii]|nr:hypothetical protein HN011_001533 [Eciton burchellii]